MGQGHRFRTNSDTETLVHLYEQEGAEGLARLRGMFAFAIWDARKREILLARDRFGKKPMYYAETPAGLFFGSELKCPQPGCRSNWTKKRCASISFSATFPTRGACSWR
jgi:asparagine synthase (glutamine-hydrolysing)